MHSAAGRSRWPESPPFRALAERWGKAAGTRFMELAWKAFDNFNHRLTFGPDADNLERRVNDHIYHGICDQLDLHPFRLVRLQHEPWEFSAQRTRPPQPDLAFVVIAQRDAKWPIEGKVLVTDGATAEYTKEVETNFIPCRYGSESTEGALFGYLLDGSADKVFEKVARSLSTTLESHVDFRDRPHRVSTHARSARPGEPPVPPVRIHHLIMLLPWPK